MSTLLGDFLRERRDTARPEDLGLPRGARRRVPGLRRSELAALAGISVEYLVRIEQGRDRNPSMQIVVALGDALRLDATERQHLHRLATMTEGSACRPAAVPVRDDVRVAVRAVLDQLEPGVALVTNRLGDVLARTSTFALVAGPSGLLDVGPGARPNLTRYVFTDERARTTFPDWDRVADERAFDLWFGPSHDRVQAFRAQLEPLAGEELRRRRDRVTPPPRAVLRWVHPDGELRFDREVLELPADDAQQVVVLLPADGATADALAALRRAASAPLRAVR